MPYYPVQKSPKQTPVKPLITRVGVLRLGLMIVGALLVGRLFYVQIIRHDYYTAQAMSEHVKKFAIPAERGVIKVMDGSDQTLPVVLNETRYLIYADPQFVKDPDKTADKLVGILGGDKNSLEAKLKTAGSRYVILAKKLSKDQAERIEKLDLDGIGQKEFSTRTYPQGLIAAQVLGFVNDDGQGQYGIEGFLNDELKGVDGQQKAITDVRGIPLASNDNVLKPPQNGQDITLTIDMTMQRLVEERLKAGIERTKSLRGSVVILDANSGAVKAMANYPSFDPTSYAKVEDQSTFINGAISYAWEPGSVMKPLVVATALNEGKASPNTTYYDAGYTMLADRKVTNAINYGAQTMSVRQVLEKSLNTGAVEVLRMIGGGSINEAARQTYHRYLTEHFRFGQTTGIELDGDVTGYVAPPDDADGLNVRYGNMAFGQGMTVTPLQLAAAYVSLVNDGTYYQPHIVAAKGDKATASNVLMAGVVSQQTSAELREMLKSTLEINNKAAIRSGYNLGAKSGTAQVAGQGGAYKTDAYNGAYVGFIGGDKPEYVMVVRLDEPKTSGFASFQASVVWAEISNKLLDTVPIKPASR